MDNKKSLAIGSIIAVVIAAIGLSIGLWVLSISFGSVDMTIAQQMSNETNTSAIVTGTYYDLLATGYGGFEDINTASVVITNSTNTWTTSNYTAYSNGTIVFGTVNNALLGTAYFSYVYDAPNQNAWTVYQTVQNNTWSAFNLMSVAIIVMAFGVIVLAFMFGKQ
jgi:hypothetical protein